MSKIEIVGSPLGRSGPLLKIGVMKREDVVAVIVSASLICEVDIEGAANEWIFASPLTVKQSENVINLSLNVYDMVIQGYQETENTLDLARRNYNYIFGMIKTRVESIGKSLSDQPHSVLIAGASSIQELMLMDSAHDTGLVNSDIDVINANFCAYISLKYIVEVDSGYETVSSKIKMSIQEMAYWLANYSFLKQR